MRILYITSVLGPKGGSEIYCRDIIKELVARGHNACVVSTMRHDVAGAEMLYLPVFGHHAFYKFEAPLFAGRVLKKAEEFRPDIVMSHSNSMMGWLGHRVKEKLGIPHVLLIELISSQNKTLHTKTIHAAEKFLLPKLNYDKLIVWTQNMKEKFLLPWGIPEKKIIVQGAALKAENYNVKGRGKWVRDRYGKNLIIVFRTLWGSNVLGIEFIVKAMRAVAEKHPGWKLVIFGDGNDRHRLVGLVERLGLQKSALFGGHVVSGKALDVLAATDISPHSFVYEFSTSISLLENMAAGNACIATDVGSVRELVGNTALAVKAEDEKAIAEAINRLIENPELRRELGRKAGKRFLKKYSIGATVDMLEKTFAALVKEYSVKAKK